MRVGSNQARANSAFPTRGEFGALDRGTKSLAFGSLPTRPIPRRCRDGRIAPRILGALKGLRAGGPNIRLPDFLNGLEGATVRAVFAPSHRRGRNIIVTQFRSCGTRTEVLSVECGPMGEALVCPHKIQTSERNSPLCSALKISGKVMRPGCTDHRWRLTSQWYSRSH